MTEQRLLFDAWHMLCVCSIEIEEQDLVRYLVQETKTKKGKDMKNSFRNLAALVVGTAGCAMICNQAQAIPIDGSIQFSIEADASGVSGAGATTISFVNPGSVTVDTLDYASVPTGVASPAVTVNTLKFTGTGAAAVLSASVSPEWVFTYGGDTYSFDLTALTFASVTKSGSLSQMLLQGSGVAHITGFDDTIAVWTLSGTDGGGLKFTASSESTTATGVGVPDGGLTVALLGFAFVGVEGFRRKIRK